MQNRKRRHTIPVALAALVVVAASCGPAAPGTSTPTAVTTDAADSTSPSSTAETMPAGLLGAWEAIITTGQEVTLTVGRGTYRVNREGATGAGSIAVDGNVIAFRSPQCEAGAGSYEWSIQGDELTFVPLEPRDPCGGRIIFLEDATYTRVE